MTVKGTAVTVAVVPVPGVKPWGPYSTVHEVASPCSVHVIEIMLESMPASVRLSTGRQSGTISTVRSSR